MNLLQFCNAARRMTVPGRFASRWNMVKHGETWWNNLRHLRHSRSLGRMDGFQAVETVPTDLRQTPGKMLHNCRTWIHRWPWMTTEKTFFLPVWHIWYWMVLAKLENHLDMYCKPCCTPGNGVLNVASGKKVTIRFAVLWGLQASALHRSFSSF